MRNTLIGLFLLCSITTSSAQNRELIPFGDFENWLSRDIKESFLIGGKVQRIYAIAPEGNIEGPVPYRRGVSPWSTSNALAIVSGITKTSNTAFPEVRTSGGGRAAKMESSLVSCKVLGLVNITVMVCGSVFLGETIEPISDTKNPYSKLDMGIPFTKRPAALIYDYNTIIKNKGVIITAKGWGTSESKGTDYAQTIVMLQNRTELPDGSIIARRVATGKEYITRTTNGWVNEHKLPLHYGDITKMEHFKPHMGLSDTYYAKNSRGEMVSVKEIGWATADIPVTHVIVFFSSGYHEAFVGALGNTFKIDNVKFEY